MSGFATLKARVADEMKRGELTASATAVQSAVLDAIKFYEGRRFPFNEFLDTGHVTVADSPYVTLTATLRVVKLDTVKVTIGSRDYPLKPTTWLSIDSIDSGQWSGYPEYYARYLENRLRLYPIPNDAYTVKLSGIKKLEEVSAGATASASNAWTGVLEEPVRLYAKGVLFRDQLRAPELAQVAFTEAERKMREYKRESRQYQSGGHLKAPSGYF
jgi:hypothetical protein